VEILEDIVKRAEIFIWVILLETSAILIVKLKSSKASMSNSQQQDKNKGEVVAV